MGRGRRWEPADADPVPLILGVDANGQPVGLLSDYVEAHRGRWAAGTTRNYNRMLRDFARFLKRDTGASRLTVDLGRGSGVRVTRPDSAVARALRPVAEPILREVGLREIDRRLGRALGSTSAALAADYHPSVDWWGDALAACGRGLRVEVAADGTVVQAEVTGGPTAPRTECGICGHLPCMCDQQ